MRKEGNGLKKELKKVINDHDFQLHGRLKESFVDVIDKFPLFRNGHKGPEMTIALRKMMENQAH